MLNRTAGKILLNGALFVGSAVACYELQGLLKSHEKKVKGYVGNLGYSFADNVLGELPCTIGILQSFSFLSACKWVSPKHLASLAVCLPIAAETGVRACYNYFTGKESAKEAFNPNKILEITPLLAYFYAFFRIKASVNPKGIFENFAFGVVAGYGLGVCKYALHRIFGQDEEANKMHGNTSMSWFTLVSGVRSALYALPDPTGFVKSVITFSCYEAALDTYKNISEKNEGEVKRTNNSIIFAPHRLADKVINFFKSTPPNGPKGGAFAGRGQAAGAARG